jgi:hypothetical protein
MHTEAIPQHRPDNNHVSFWDIQKKENAMTKVAFAFAIALLSSLLAVGTSLARKLESLTVQIPFSFDAVGKIYSSGEYRFETRRTSMGDLHLLSSPDGQLLQILSTIRIESSKGDPGRKLVFRRYAGHCSLLEIWNGQSNGQLIVPSPAAPADASEVAVIAQIK